MRFRGLRWSVFITIPRALDQIRIVMRESEPKKLNLAFVSFGATAHGVRAADDRRIPDCGPCWLVTRDPPGRYGAMAGVTPLDESVVTLPRAGIKRSYCCTAARRWRTAPPTLSTAARSPSVPISSSRCRIFPEAQGRVAKILAAPPVADGAVEFIEVGPISSVLNGVSTFVPLLGADFDRRGILRTRSATPRK